MANIPIHNGELVEVWTDNAWQTVRYERDGWASAFLVLEDDTTHTRACTPR